MLGLLHHVRAQTSRLPRLRVPGVFNHRSSHTSQEQLVPLMVNSPADVKTIKLEDIVHRDRLGGLIKSYEQVAALVSINLS